MPSPFPGMDPYLEHPEVFPDLHDRLIIHAGESIQASLPQPYYATVGRRIWVEFAGRKIGPDVNVLHPRTVGTLRQPTHASEHEPQTPAAVAIRSSSRVVVVTPPQDDVRETFIEVFVGQRQDKQLVTTLEILIPTNKTPGAHGQDLYRRQQDEVLQSKINLVEIDLIRAGSHTTAVPFERAVDAAGHFDYHVCVHQFEHPESYYVYPFMIQERLPEIAVPLLPGDDPVMLDLQELFDRSYDAGPYQREIDYLHDTPVPPLPQELLEWARSRVTGSDQPGAHRDLQP